MSYDVEKLIDIFTIFSKNKQELDKLRIAKLLYFIDKSHLRKYGRVVLGDRYYRMDHGPAPSLTLDLLNELFDPEFEFYVANKKIKKNILYDYLKVKGPYQLKLKKISKFDSLSVSEIEVINEVIKELGSLKTGDLIELSHKDATWKKTRENKEIDYCLFLEGLPDDEKKIIKGIMEIDSENQKYADKLENGCCS